MSLMLCAIMIVTPVNSLLSLEAAFRPFDALLGRDAALLRAKAVYVLVLLGVLGVSLWKLGQLGILPITDADFIRSLPLSNNGVGSIGHVLFKE